MGRRFSFSRRKQENKKRVQIRLASTYSQSTHAAASSPKRRRAAPHRSDGPVGRALPRGDAAQRRLRHLRRCRCLRRRAGGGLWSSQALGDEQRREKV